MKKIPSQQGSNAPVIITGAENYLATEIITNYLKANVPVVAISSYPISIKDPLLNSIVLDLENEMIPHELFRGVSKVLHLAWKDFETSYETELASTATSSNMKVLENVLLTAAKNRLEAFFLHSFLGADSHAPTVLLKEKHKAESLLVNSTIPQKIIVRTGVLHDFVGKQRDPLMDLVVLLTESPLMIPIFRSHSQIALTDICKVAAFIYKTCEEDSAASPLIFKEIKSSIRVNINDLIKRHPNAMKTKKLFLSGFLGRAMMSQLMRLKKFRSLQLFQQFEQLEEQETYLTNPISL